MTGQAALAAAAECSAGRAAGRTARPAGAGAPGSGRAAPRRRPAAGPNPRRRAGASSVRRFRFSSPPRSRRRSAARAPCLLPERAERDRHRTPRVLQPPNRRGHRPVLASVDAEDGYPPEPDRPPPRGPSGPPIGPVPAAPRAASAPRPISRAERRRQPERGGRACAASAKVAFSSGIHPGRHPCMGPSRSLTSRPLVLSPPSARTAPRLLVGAGGAREQQAGADADASALLVTSGLRSAAGRAHAEAAEEFGAGVVASGPGSGETNRAVAEAGDEDVVAFVDDDALPAATW